MNLNKLSKRMRKRIYRWAAWRVRMYKKYLIQEWKLPIIHQTFQFKMKTIEVSRAYWKGAFPSE